MKEAIYKLLLKKGDLNALYNKLVEGKMEFLELDNVSEKNVKDFVNKKRKDIITYEISIKDEDTIKLSFVASNEEDGKFLLKMFEDAREREIPMEALEIAPIPIGYIKDCIDGKRDSLISFNLGKLEDGDEIPEGI